MSDTTKTEWFMGSTTRGEFYAGMVLLVAVLVIWYTSYVSNTDKLQSQLTTLEQKLAQTNTSLAGALSAAATSNATVMKRLSEPPPVSSGTPYPVPITPDFEMVLPPTGEANTDYAVSIKGWIPPTSDIYLDDGAKTKSGDVLKEPAIVAKDGTVIHVSDITNYILHLSYFSRSGKDSGEETELKPFNCKAIQNNLYKDVTLPAFLCQVNISGAPLKPSENKPGEKFPATMNLGVRYSFVNGDEELVQVISVPTLDELVTDDDQAGGVKPGVQRGLMITRVEAVCGNGDGQTQSTIDFKEMKFKCYYKQLKVLF